MLTALVALIALVVAGPFLLTVLIDLVRLLGALIPFLLLGVLIIIAILVDLFRLFGAILPILLFGVLAVSTIHVLFG